MSADATARRHLGGLDRILAGWGLPSDFMAAHWRCRHAIGRVEPHTWDLPELPDGGLTPLLGQGLRSDRVSISTAGRLHHPAEYTVTRTIAGQPVSDIVDPQGVARLVEAGATVVLADVELWLPGAMRTAAVLAEEFGCEVQAHVFATGSGHAGLVPHADGEDNILIQLSGDKTWSLWEADGWGSRHADRDALGTPTEVVTLRPGDVLYIPLGWVHAATAGEQGSTHITYQVVPVSLLDGVLDQLADVLEPVVGHRPAPVGRSGPLTDHQIAEIADRLVHLLDLP